MSSEQPAVTSVVGSVAVEVPAKQVGAAALVAMEEGKGIVLRSMEDLIRFGRMIVEAGAAPSWAYGGRDETSADAMKRAAGACAIAIQAGLEHGLGYLGGLQAFIVLDGHISWKAEAAAAKIRNSPVCRPGSLRFWTEGAGSEMKGVAVAHRVGYAEPDRREFTFAQAKQASLLGKKNWMNYPARMFQWRALSWLAKDVFSDVLGNVPLADEVEDFEVVRRAPAQRAALPPPSSPDPLLARLGLAPAPTAEPAPFPSHAEADAAIAAAEAEGE